MYIYNWDMPLTSCINERNYIPEKRKFLRILCFCQQRSCVRRRVTISLVAYGSEMARNAIESELRTWMVVCSYYVKIVALIWNGMKSFWTSKMATGAHLTKKHLQKKMREWFEQCSNRLLADYNLIYIYNIHFWSIYIQTGMLGRTEYIVCSTFRANAYNSSWNTLAIVLTHDRCTTCMTDGPGQNVHLHLYFP